jgi:hypothetical protein
MPGQLNDPRQVVRNSPEHSDEHLASLPAITPFWEDLHSTVAGVGDLGWLTVTDVANLFKAAAKVTREDVVAMRTALETAFDPAVRDMEDGAWESDAATAWFKELIYHRDAVFGPRRPRLPHCPGGRRSTSRPPSRFSAFVAAGHQFGDGPRPHPARAGSLVVRSRPRQS